MPSYRAFCRQNLEDIGKLYAARNSMHEGDRYFKDVSGTPVIVDFTLAQRFLSAAVKFAIWLDLRA